MMSVLIFSRPRPLFKDHQIIKPKPQKIRSLTEKNRPIMTVLPSHASIMLMGVGEGGRGAMAHLDFHTWYRIVDRG